MSHTILVSFLMPAKNAAEFLAEAIEGVQKLNKQAWELIIIDDHSTDNTYDVALNAAKNDTRIKVFKNTNAGQAAALNKGYSESSGNYVKFIDADDVIHKDYMDCFENMELEVFYHNAYTTDHNLTAKSISKVNQAFIERDYKYCLENLVSIARCLGTMPRTTADQIFPIIEENDCADYWIALMVKKHVKKITYIDKPLYYYRQHESQTYGGIYRFSVSKVFFRAKRKLNFARSVEENWHLTGLTREEVSVLLKPMKTYLSLLGKEDLKTTEIIKSKLSIKQKLKLFFMRKFPILLSIVKLGKSKIAKLAYKG